MFFPAFQHPCSPNRPAGFVHPEAGGFTTSPSGTPGKAHRGLEGWMIIVVVTASTNDL